MAAHCPCQSRLYQCNKGCDWLLTSPVSLVICNSTLPSTGGSKQRVLSAIMINHNLCAMIASLRACVRSCVSSRCVSGHVCGHACHQVVRQGTCAFMRVIKMCVRARVRSCVSQQETCTIHSLRAHLQMASFHALTCVAYDIRFVPLRTNTRPTSMN